MKTITYQGIISFPFEGKWMRIVLTQEDGLQVDLVYRLREIQNSFPGKKVQVSFYVSDEPTTKEAATKSFLDYLYGSPDAGYENNGRMYSEWTGYVESYDTEFSIGGHSLTTELMYHKGKYLIIDFNLS